MGWSVTQCYLSTSMKAWADVSVEVQPPSASRLASPSTDSRLPLVGEAGASSVQVVSLYVSRNLRLPLVSIVEKLFLVVQQLLMAFCGELKVGALEKKTPDDFQPSVLVTRKSQKRGWNEQ